MAKKETERKYVFSSALIEEINDKINDGVVIKRYQNPWFKNEVGIRRAGISFKMSPDELNEYIKCKLDIKYFAEKYCKVKTEDGSVRNIKLRDYQEEILDLYMNNRFSILCGSRQIGKCFSYNTNVMFFLNGVEYECQFGQLYYEILSKIRRLTFLEKAKIFLYKLLYRLDNYPKK